MGKQTSSLKPSKPLKRPQQLRSKFTVQSIFDAYVRIWQQEGWDKLTTRKVALEAGFAVGTLYEYFPGKEALHSGYVRHCIERMIERVDEIVVGPAELQWQERIHGLIHILCGLDQGHSAWFHPDMMGLEPVVADQKHQRRAHEELLSMWRRVLLACKDLPNAPPAERIETLHLAVWGGRRYAIQLQLDSVRMAEWAADMERLCCGAIAEGGGG